MKTLSKLTLLAVMLLGGVNSVKADDTFGTISTGWNEGGNEATTSKRVFDLEPNKTLTLKFTVNNTSKAGDWAGWITIVRNALLGSGTEYYFMQPSCFGVTNGDWTNASSNTAEGHWFLLNDNNYDWSTSGAGTTEDPTVYAFRENLIGASVVLSFRRMGPDVCMKTIVTTSAERGSKQFSHYFVMTCGDGTQTLKIYLGADQAELTLKSSEVTTDVLEGTLVGWLNQTGRLSNHGNIEHFTLAPEKSMNLRFKLHTTRLHDWGTWLFEVSGVEKLYTLPVGNQNSWGELKIDENIVKTNWPATTYELLEKMDGATIDMSVVREGAKVTMTAVHTPLSGEPFTLTASITPNQDGFATSDIVIRPLVELSYIDLLPVTKTITAAGWATYCSPYALDFTGTIANLENAYFVTGNTGNSLELTEISQVVPAGTGILLKGSGECQIPIRGVGTAVTSNKLIGVTAESVQPAGIYVLMNESNGVGFYKANNAFTVGANTAYLPSDAFGTSAPGSDFFSFGGEATAIDNVKSDALTFGEFFDMQGRRVAHPAKGLYIMNGRKVVVK